MSNLFSILASFAFLTLLPCYIQGAPASNEHTELFLTPLIKSGDVTKARELSEDHMKDFHVKSSTNENLKSYSGYLTIDEATNSNLFFWFFPSLEIPEKAPIIMWLNEVAGSSCLKGIFLENGPFYVDDKLELRDRELTWVKKNSMLYLDAPVGTGFSFTDKEEGYAKNSEDDATEVFEALQQFFTLFPDFQNRDFYLAGEGLSANHIPRMVKIIEVGNKDGGKVKINLKGFLVGSPVMNAKVQLRYAEPWFAMGLIDEHQRKEVEEQDNKVRALIDAKKLIEAHAEVFKIVMTPGSLYPKFTGLTSQLNMLNGIDPPEVTNFAKFIDEKEVHNYLHVGLHNFEIFNFKVHDKFNPEIMGGDGKAMESVLDGYKVLLYSGQMDPVIPHMHVSKAVDALQWSKAEEYKKAPRKIWKVGDDVAGYIKTTGNFTYITLRKTGRYAIMDQPLWGFEMIQNFIEDKPF